MAVTRSNGCVLSVSSAGRPMSSSPPASVGEDKPERRVDGKAHKAERRAQEQQEADPDDVDRRLDDAVDDPEANVAPGEVNVDGRIEAHEYQRKDDRVEDR